MGRGTKVVLMIAAFFLAAAVLTADYCGNDEKALLPTPRGGPFFFGRLKNLWLERAFQVD